MADETTRVDTWLFARLTGAPALTALVGGGTPRIFADEVPQGEAFPAVVHQLQGSADVRTATGNGRIMINGLWLVKAIVRSDTFADASPIADQIDALLEDAPGGTAGDGMVFDSVREAPFRLVERDDASVTYRHLGGLYRIHAQVP